jgi:hypothetical protein
VKTNDPQHRMEVSDVVRRATFGDPAAIIATGTNMRKIRHMLWLATLSALLVAKTCTSAAVPATEGEINFETRALKYVIGTNGANRHFLDRRTGAD